MFPFEISMCKYCILKHDTDVCLLGFRTFYTGGVERQSADWSRTGTDQEREMDCRG